MPFFNRQNNDDLILAIQVAGMSSGRNGFRKDKGGEKTCRIGSHRLAAFVACGERTLLEHRTDAFSPMRSKLQAVDTLYIGCEKFPYHDTILLSMSGVL